MGEPGRGPEEAQAGGAGAVPGGSAGGGDPERRRARVAAVACVLIVAASIGVFAVALDGPFVFDDEAMILRGRLTHDGPDLGGMLFVVRDPTEGYRPLVSWSLALNWALGGTDPRGYHVVNLVLHALCACLVFFLARRLEFADGPALAAALVFAVHPVHAEVVAAIAQRACALGGVFYLLGWLAWLSGGARGLALSLAACLLGLLSWEGTATLPAALFLTDAALRRPVGRSGWTRAWLAYAAYALPLTLYLGLRAGAVGTLGNPRPLYFAGCSWLVAALTEARFFVEHYVPGLLVGAQLSADYSWPSVPNAATTDPWAWACAAAGLGLAGGAAWRLWRSGSRAALGILVCLVAFAPVSNLIVPFYALGAQRYAYLPSIGVCLAAAAGVARLAAAPAAGVRRLGLAAAGLALAGLAARAVVAAGDWTDPVRLYRVLLVQTPLNPVARHSLAAALAGRGRLDEAIAEYRAVLEIDPGFVLTWHDLGWAYLDSGRPNEAQACFEALLARTEVWAGEPSESGREARRLAAEGQFGLGRILRQRGQVREAEPHFRRALELDPRLAGAWSSLGQCLEETGRAAAAEAAYRAGAAADPAALGPLRNLGALLEQAGRTGEAATAFRAAIARDPACAEAHLSLGLLLMRGGVADEGTRELDAFLRLAEGRPDLATLAAEVRRRLHRDPAPGPK